MVFRRGSFHRLPTRLTRWLPAFSAAVVVALLVLGLPAHGQAQTLAIADASGTRQELSDFVQFTGTDLPASEIAELSASDWRQASGDVNLGYTTQPHWFRLTVSNSSDQTIVRVIELAYPLLDKVAVYTATAGQLDLLAATGDTLHFNSRPVAHRNFLFPITLAAKESATVYLHIQTSGALQVPLTLWDPAAFAEHSDLELTLESMFYGVMLVMALFNLFLYLSLRERAYLYYVGVVSATLVLIASLDGVTFQYLYPGLPLVHQYVIMLIVPLIQLWVCLFTREYLELRGYHPVWNRAFLGLIGLTGFGALSAVFMPYELSTRFCVLMAVVVALANISVGIVLWQKGNKNARLFTIAWLALLGGSLLTLLNKLGFLPTSQLTDHGIPIGASALALLFAFALADRFNRERRASVRERQATLEALKQQRGAEAALLRASSHHELTGLPDRSIFERVVDQAISGNEAAPSAVFMLHLRRFDDINKTLGHRYADELLTLFADRMNRLVAGTVQAVYLEGNGPDTKCVAHVEGVSFAFALQDDDRQRLLTQAAELAERFAEPIEFKGLLLEMGFVIGASFVETLEDDAQTLLRHAFIALDQAGVGGGNMAVYKAEMNPYSPRRLTLMTELREALRSDRLELHFQPQIHLASARVAGFEALLRWSHPQHGFIPPDEFIPMAEQTGLIKPLTQWVLQKALSFCNTLDKAGCDATVSVNISAINLREPDFCDEVCDLLAKNYVVARRLVLEVTETAAMLDPKRSLRVLQALKSAKVRLSIDDFGTGHSSLSYIRQLPVNEIKIDRSFVMGMDRNHGDATIVRTTINMCHDLGYEVVAEGVENETTQALLRKLGCDYVQGYHLARPMRANDALVWLAESAWSKHSSLTA
ncbi:EAL domain-containing protein [Marinobacter salicampi]|uniref:EAL domain-containing protein n=1 Tax=Marinobacter salicampi TaxID=435907 RepID=UPI00140B3CF0|nr:EAL domain-containing protein [Marinobacter salicampi]